VEICLADRGSACRPRGCADDDGPLEVETGYDDDDDYGRSGDASVQDTNVESRRRIPSCLAWLYRKGSDC
jgi:hypothetical protein